MEQKPIAGAEPLARPDADVARAYLAEVEAVAQRRESRIDRRRMARLQIVEAIVLSAYLTLMMFGFGGADGGASFLPVVAVLLLWVQFSGELRESYGFQPRRSWRANLPLIVFGAIALAALLVGLTLQISGTEISLPLRLAPGVLMLLVFGAEGVIVYRRSLRTPALAHSPARFTTGARTATLVLGMLLAGAIWISGIADPLLSSAFGLLIVLGLLGWFIAAQLSARVPALGEMWAWPQWSALAVGAAAASFTTVAAGHAIQLSTGAAGLLGASVALLFVIAALWGVRRVD